MPRSSGARAPDPAPEDVPSSRCEEPRMSPDTGAARAPRAKVTPPRVVAMKRKGEPIAVVTAYDHPTARLADEAGMDVLLVGDSVGTVVLGYESTLPVTMEEM